MTKFLNINPTLLCSFVLLIATVGWAQVAVNISGAVADPSAMLDISSTARGFLAPRMTTAQRDAISSPAEGLILFNLTTGTLEVYNGSAWITPPGGFECGTSIVCDIDGNLINTSLIGDQCWLTSNLNTGTMIETTTESTDNGIIERYCYNNEDDSCDIYGGLYKWDEMMQYVTAEGAQGICPSGWRIPTADEIETLILYLGGEGSAGGKLKMTGTRYWCSGNTTSNEYGFKALGSGYFGTNHGMTDIRASAKFWTSSASGVPENAYQMSLVCIGTGAYLEDDGSTMEGYSVRCIRIED